MFFLELAFSELWFGFLNFWKCVVGVKDKECVFMFGGMCCLFLWACVCVFMGMRFGFMGMLLKFVARCF